MDKSFSASDVKDILNLIEDGFLFERFGHEFLAARLGYNFIASGGIKDRGIDGLEYVSQSDKNEKDVFQISIDKNPSNKIKSSIQKLEINKITCDRLTYFTNVYIKNKDELIDELLEQKGFTLRIFDSSWIADNANNSVATKSVIANFIKNHLRKYQKPGEGLVINDYLKNPNLYVYLMHQIENTENIQNLNHNLIDTLILYSLRDTDPDKNIFQSSDEILASVRELLNFEIEKIQSKINKRLKNLSKKPNKKVNHHTIINKYCLPYETRLETVSNNARDKSLYDIFHKEAENVISKNLQAESVNVRDISKLLHKTLEKIFFRQGLEFSDFLLNKGCRDTFEGNLHDTVEEILNESSIINKNKAKVKDALIVSIRQLIYHGSKEAKQYLLSLSKTYLMLFLLKCEPKIVDFFQSMAGNLTIFVCTSILVPTFSEIYLEPQNQRYWSLLKSAKSRGVKLVVNDTIISELDFHIKRSKHLFDTEYSNYIDFYSDGAEDLVDQILIRAFIYALKEGKITSYDKFIDNFITINSNNTKQELIDFLYEEFGIEYMLTDDIKIDVEKDKLDSLINELERFKKSRDKARSDAKLILTIYNIRKISEEESSSIDGYKTWWLSSDTMTHKSVCKIFKDKYPVSCYMRPDFLYNYISFTPHKEAVEEVYKKIFPNLLGMHISNHIPSEISVSIRKMIQEHSEKMDGRVKAKIRNLVDKLKSNHKYDYKEELKSFFED